MPLSAIAIPTSIEQTGVGRKLLEELALKIVYFGGELFISDLADRMCVSLSIADELFQRLRRDQLCEVTGMAGGVHRIAISSQGRTRALELLSVSQYAGPAPVSIVDYVQQVRMQTVMDMTITPAKMRQALSHLVIDDNVVQQLGTALTSGKTIFLYGSTGSGKSTVADALGRLFTQDQVWIPYAVDVEGQVITLYDALLHEKVDHGFGAETDARWVCCRRPRVVVGGELTIEMLDLQFNPITKYYSGPLQMKANNGLLIIDDFGRQRVRPDELLNRWIVPLDRRIDFLTLAGGKKIEIPFDMFVVFATNLRPSSLVDEAFLRRLNTKVKLDVITAVQFQEIFQRVCDQNGLEYDARLVERLIEVIQEEFSQPLRACYPRDIIQQICWSARYQSRMPVLDWPALAQACQNYFVQPEDAPAESQR